MALAKLSCEIFAKVHRVVAKKEVCGGGNRIARNRGRVRGCGAVVQLGQSNLADENSILPGSDSDFSRGILKATLNLIELC